MENFNYVPEDSIMHLRDGMIENITSDNRHTLLTVSYTDCVECQRREQTIRLAVDRNTQILDENGNRIPSSELRVGMTINAVFSSAMTRSIPPQSAALLIQITGSPVSSNVTIGRIVNIDKRNRNFTTISDRNLSSTIQFNVPVGARIFDVFGRPMDFSRLSPGMRVQVRHATFMTASIPPQTTAFEVRVIR